MSKKTNEAKRKAAMKRKPRKRLPRSGKRPNPALMSPIPTPPAGLILSDPILFRHLAGFILRSLELYTPNTATGFGNFSPATFLTPEGLTGTVNPDPPEDKADGQEQS